MSKFDQPSPVINDSAAETNTPTTQATPVTTETPTSKETQVDFETQVLQFFRKDIQYMIDLFENGVRSTDNWADKDDSLIFCALALSNPDDPLGMPIIITRPVERPDKTQIDDIKNNDYQFFHKDIWNEWQVLADSNPSDKRSLVFSWLNSEGRGYKKAQHIFLKIKEVNGNSIVHLEQGWNYLKTAVAKRLEPTEQFPQLGQEEIEILLKQLQKYGLNTEKITMRENPALVESFVLERMLEPTIEKNAEKLRAILTPRAVREYIALANRFLTNPNQDKASPLYAKFLEYEEILEKLE